MILHFKYKLKQNVLYIHFYIYICIPTNSLYIFIIQVNSQDILGFQSLVNLYIA